jgi:nitroreductase/NAD-dependent dihydropyrimidine dehydrogenase PreA subunit
MPPVIDRSLCNDCGLCVLDCAVAAIHPGEGRVYAERCMACGHCVAVCPPGAVAFPGLAAPAILPSIEGAEGSYADLVRRRRSVRRYSAEAIADETLGRILDLVRYAPTGKNSQQVFVTLLATRARVGALADETMRFFSRLAAAALNGFTRPLIMLFLGAREGRKLFGYKAHLRSYREGRDILTYGAPALFVFHAPRSSPTPEQDALIWATTAAYHAESLGLGTCFNGFLVRGLNAKTSLKESIGIPRGHKVQAVFTAGHPALSYMRSVVRSEVKAAILK